MFLHLTALGRITGVNVTGPGNITIEWMEPDFSYGCVEKYDITKSNGDSSPCENSPYVCEDCRCKERELTVIPVLRNGIRVENSRSDPVIVGKGKYANVRSLVMLGMY